MRTSVAEATARTPSANVGARRINEEPSTCTTAGQGRPPLTAEMSPAQRLRLKWHHSKEVGSSTPDIVVRGNHNDRYQSHPSRPVGPRSDGPRHGQTHRLPRTDWNSSGPSTSTQLWTAKMLARSSALIHSGPPSQLIPPPSSIPTTSTSSLSPQPRGSATRSPICAPSLPLASTS